MFGPNYVFNLCVRRSPSGVKPRTLARFEADLRVMVPHMLLVQGKRDRRQTAYDPGQLCVLRLCAYSRGDICTEFYFAFKMFVLDMSLKTRLGVQSQEPERKGPTCTPTAEIPAPIQCTDLQFDGQLSPQIYNSIVTLCADLQF